MWFGREVKPRLAGNAALLRYADDAVLLFANETGARRVLEVLPKRLGDRSTLERVKKTPVAGLRIRGARLRCPGSTCIRAPSSSRLRELAPPWPAG
jgi:hypothetical protein